MHGLLAASSSSSKMAAAETCGWERPCEQQQQQTKFFVCPEPFSCSTIWLRTVLLKAEKGGRSLVPFLGLPPLLLLVVVLPAACSDDGKRDLHSKQTTSHREGLILSLCQTGKRANERDSMKDEILPRLLFFTRPVL